ncbi:hypothetical protein PVAND_010776 [Polypedilum vanderplanki]|uniref:Ionotropic glutamate receptor L-glutamate and glycine-binding domain-containing protein n=1 Tax=Polypedilum vanderplanki TaxID=319348 RepID=A0A9J6CGL9_POLVA|nr:hypothetical protein PVAND_010776 [Polypedilum vanderplanki]
MTFLLINLIIFGSSFALDANKFIRDTTKQVNSDMIKVIHFVFKEIYFNQYRTVNVMDCVENPNDQYFKDFKNAVFLIDNLTIPYQFRKANNSYMEPGKTRLKVKNLFIIDTYNSYLNIERFFLIDRFNFRGQYLFAFIHGRLDDEATEKIFKRMWEKGLYNVNFLYEENNVVKMTTFQPFQTNTCESMEEILIDTFVNGTFIRGGNIEIIFPKNKFKNLYKCPIKIVTFERCPAMCYNKKENKFSGYDWELIQEISQQLNFKMEVKYLEGEEQWGTILSNGSLTGGLKELVEKRAEIGIGNYFLRESRTRIVDYSAAYFSISIVLVIPPATKLSPFEKLLRPFEIIIWILLFITFSIGLLVIFIINYKLKNFKSFVFGRKVNTPILNMFIAIFGQQQTILPGRNYARFILMMFLIFCLVNRNVYQGALYIFLQSDGRHKDIKSIDEMIEKDFKFYVYESYIDFVHNSSEIYKRKIIIRNESELPFSKEVDENLKAAFMTPQTNVINRNQMNQGKFSLKVCDELVSVINIAIFFKRNFFLKTAIDENLKNFDAAGFFTYWFNKHADKKFLNAKDGITGPKKLNMEHLFGVFNIMLIGYAIATIFFILEIFIFKFKGFRMNKYKSRLIFNVSNINEEDTNEKMHEIIT